MLLLFITMAKIDEVLTSIQASLEEESVKQLSLTKFKELVKDILQGLTNKVLTNGEPLTLVGAGKFYRKELPATIINLEGEDARDGKDATEYVAFKSVERVIENYNGKVRVITKNNLNK